MKKIFIIPGSLIMGILVFSSCQKDVLDKAPLDSYTEDAVWGDLQLVEAFVNQQYNILPGPGHFWSNLTNRTWVLSAVCDEAHNRFNDYDVPVMVSGSLTADNLKNFDIWGITYTRIQDCNTILSKIDNVPGEEATKKRLKGETTYLRAYAYFKLASDYGGVPLIKTPNTISDEFKKQRSTYEECIKFVVDECDAAAGLLPDSYSSGDSKYGRATKGGALALKSRALLYAASPQWNAANDQAKWQKASDAAKAVIDMNTNYQFYNGKYINITTTLNSELIMVRLGNKQYLWKSFQGSETFLSPNGYHGWSSFAPSQNLVDAFGTADGKDISDPTSGYNPQRPYVNRDPRFYSDIIFDGRPYGKPEFFKDRYEAGGSNVAQMYEGGLDSDKGFDAWNSSLTRYSFRKYIDTTYNFNVETQTNKFWIVARLTEIYLNYAEAQFMMGDEAGARQYLDLIRHRGGITVDLPASLTGADLLKKIQNERQVELCLEGHRYYDVRRWKIADVTENKPLGGVKIVKNADGSKTYTYSNVQDRAFKPQHYLLPIPRAEIRSTGLPQNPGYD